MSTASLQLMFGGNALQGLLDQFASHRQGDMSKNASAGLKDI